MIALRTRRYVPLQFNIYLTKTDEIYLKNVTIVQIKYPELTTFPIKLLEI